MGSGMMYGYSSGAPGGTVVGNIFRGIGGALFGGSVGTGGTPANTSQQAQNQSFWKNIGVGLAGSLASIATGLFNKDKSQVPNGIITGGVAPYYPTASAQITSLIFPLAMLGLVIWGIKSLFFGKRKKY